MPELSTSSPARIGRFLPSVEAGFWLIVATMMLRLVPFGKLVREVVRDPGHDARTVDTVREIRGHVGAAASRLPWCPTCLPVALAGHMMCRARGLRVPIALSVLARGARFGAHATLATGSDEDVATGTPLGRTHLGRVELTWP